MKRWRAIRLNWIVLSRTIIKLGNIVDVSRSVTGIMEMGLSVAVDILTQIEIQLLTACLWGQGSLLFQLYLK